MTWLMGLYLSWRHRRECFHHDHVEARSWIRSRLVEGGKAKHFWCTSCGRYWT